MNGLDLLRFHEVRDAYRLIGEGRDLGSDPELWRNRFFEGLRGLVGVAVASGGECVWVGSARHIRTSACFAAGLDPAGLKHLAAWHREVGPDRCPIFQAIGSRPALLVTCSRSQVVADREWYRSPSFHYREVARIDHTLTSLYQLGPSGFSVVCVNHLSGEREFSSRQQQLVHFLHGELGPLIGRALVSSTESSPAGLSPRLRQTLACLLEGDSEKQVAARLGLSQPTTHQYVTALYRHFAVRSRAQLLAHVLRRTARGPWRELVNGPAGMLPS